ncbi:exonuclease SbcCD subunit D [Oscillatoria sp. CS-180]|uniref:metallophosphoesterase family protein n=1 Tax=Oscillatoria sp. CS-180 TaxID=3021720 RepID=UPI00232C8677|nr:exonuclease SbcCD subunit D [Oscillatoria sp. CS-180]MDB9524978.1 exonuclease SbcCD subunit D [Oscillatoria sp. CS-180]
MARFLHLADIHLGFDRYNSPERTKDFFFALSDVIQKYAIAEQVDFVLIAGDLFEHRVIQPSVLNQAQLCLQMLQAAEIPVLAIEGNHDNTPYGTSTSWLKYLSQWGILKLLEPGNLAAGEPLYSPWDDASKRGGYIDLPCGVRVIGSAWYGATAVQAIAQIAEAIPTLPPSPGPTVLMFHHGLEGQIARYSGAIRYTELFPLKEAGVDYLALGHIHKNYTEGDWIFNPGSLEANNVEESGFKRGAYLVDITADGIEATLQQDYRQRSIVRLRVTTTGNESEDDVLAMATAKVEAAIQARDLVPNEHPIVELCIEGVVGFERLDLDIRQLQKTLQSMSEALVFLVKYDVEEREFASPVADDASRDQIERNAFLDLLAGHRDYKKRANELSTALVDLKERRLARQEDEVLYQYVDDILDPS